MVTGGISTSIHFLKRNVVRAQSVADTLDRIGENSPVNLMLTSRIQEIEEEKAKKTIEEERQKRLAAEQKTNGKVAYLTFDDGPSEKVTPMILDILNEYNIKATFFVVGKMSEKYPDILKRTFGEGHAIGNHTYSHNYGYIYKSSTNFLNDLNKAERILKNILGNGFDSKIMRFPGGSFGKHKVAMRKAVNDAGFKYFDWNALNGDAEGSNRTKGQLVNRLKETTRNKKNVIILMHDTDAKETTAASLREILDYLISEGYSFDVLDENYQ